MTNRLSDAQLAGLVERCAALNSTPHHARLAKCFCVACEDRERFFYSAAACLPALIAEVQAHRAAKAAEHASAGALAGMMPLGGGEP